MYALYHILNLVYSRADSTVVVVFEQHRPIVLFIISIHTLAHPEFYVALSAFQRQALDPQPRNFNLYFFSEY